MPLLETESGTRLVVRSAMDLDARSRRLIVRRRPAASSRSINARDARAILRRCAADPLFFPNDVLGVTLWSKQEEIVRAVRKHRRVAVRSAHNVGKTYVAAVIVLDFLYTHPNSLVITTATTWHQVKHLLWAEINDLHNNANCPLGGELLLTELKLGPKWKAVGLSTKDPNSFQGSHSADVLIVFDEGQGVAPNIWHAAETMMGSQNCRWLVIGNPVDPSGPYWETFNSPETWHTIHISALEHPNVASREMVYPAAVSYEWVEERRREYGEGSPLWEIRILGNFAEAGEHMVITSGMLANAESEFDRVAAGRERHMGVDIARFGTDSNVATLMIGQRVAKQQAWSGMSTMRTTGMVRHLMRKWKVPAEHTHIDVIGVGAGVVDRLHELDQGVDGVDFATRPRNDWPELISKDTKCANRRAELHWVGRRLAQESQMCVPQRKFATAWREMTAGRYKFNSKGEILVEPKDDIKARLGRSPDYSDSILLALSRTGKKRHVSFV